MGCFGPFHELVLEPQKDTVTVRLGLDTLHSRGASAYDVLESLPRSVSLEYVSHTAFVSQPRSA